MPSDPFLGRELAGKYRIEARLGEGGMGVVYRARHLLLGTEVALKMIRPDLAATREARERFLREARAATALSSPRIVAVREVGEDRGRLYLTMDLVRGITLREALAAEGSMPAARAVAVADALFEALEAAHAAGILHRDLKPANVLLEPDLSVKVLDLGLAKWIVAPPVADETSLTAEGVAVGTLKYMSPEQVAGDAVDPRSDVYAASAVLYEMLAGRAPYEAPTKVQLARMILLEDPPPLPGPLGDFLKSGLARRPEDRPASAREARRLLALAASPPGPDTPGRRVPRRPVVLASAAGLVALAIALAAWGLTGRSEEGRREELLAAGRESALAGRWGESALAYEEALAIRETAEARMALEASRVEAKKGEARSAESEGRWEDAIRLWREAREAGGGGTLFETEIRTAQLEAALAALRAALGRGDLPAAERRLDEARALSAGPRAAEVLHDLEGKLLDEKAREEELAHAAALARERGDLIVERGEWRAYLEAFPGGQRAVLARERLAGIEHTFREGSGLVIDSDPRGASIWVAGGRKGTTPLYLADLPPGTHRIVLAKDLHRSILRTVVVPPQGAAELHSTLHPIASDLEVRSGVPGAAVVLTGEETGPRSARADGYGLAWFAGVLVGRRSVEARAPDGTVVSLPVEIADGELAVADLRGSWRPGSLEVETEPAGLDVSVGKDPPAASPVRVESLPPGWVDVVVKDPDGRERLAVARIRPGSATRIRIDLAALAANEALAYDDLARSVRGQPPREALAACDSFLDRHPGAGRMPEVVLARRVFEILAGDVAPGPSSEFEVPASFRTARGLLVEPGGMFIVRPDDSGENLEARETWWGDVTDSLPAARSGTIPARWWFAPGGRFLCVEWHDAAGRPIRYELANLLADEWEVALEEPSGAVPPAFFWHAESSSFLVARGASIDRYDLATGLKTWGLDGVRLVPEHEPGRLLPLYPIVDTDGDGEGDRALDPASGRTQVMMEGGDRVRCVVYEDRAAVYATRMGVEGGVLHLGTGIQLAPLQLPELHEEMAGGKLVFSADGSSVWSVHRNPPHLRHTPLANPGMPSSIELDLDRQRVEMTPGSRYGLVVTRAAGAGRSGPVERAAAYDLGTGELAFDLSASDFPSGLDWERVRPARSYDARHVVLTDGDRSIVVERGTGRIRFDRAIGPDRTVHWISEVDRAVVQGPLGYEIFRAEATSPLWSGPPVGAIDSERRLALVGGVDSDSVFSFADPPRPAWIDLASGASVLVDAAFARRHGRIPPVGAGPFWLVLGEDGRLRIWDEADLMRALLPHPIRLPLEPGPLLDAAREAVQAGY